MRNFIYVLLRFLKEYVFPLAASIIFIIYSGIKRPDTAWSIPSLIATFLPPFVLVSWFFERYFRICDQRKFETDLQSIQKKTTDLLEMLENKTTNLINHLTGGDSFCYLMLGSLSNESNKGIITILHHGEHTLFDISARIVDLELFDTIKNCLTIENINKTQTYISYKTLISGNCITGDFCDLGNLDKRNFNIFWTALNGNFTQLLRFRKIDGQWHYATKVMRNEKMLFEDIKPGFPANAQGEIDW